jgi:hypothetical protein
VGKFFEAGGFWTGGGQAGVIALNGLWGYYLREGFILIGPQAGNENRGKILNIF